MEQQIRFCTTSDGVRIGLNAGEPVAEESDLLRTDGQRAGGDRASGPRGELVSNAQALVVREKQSYVVSGGYPLEEHLVPRHRTDRVRWPNGSYDLVSSLTHKIAQFTKLPCQPLSRRGDIAETE